MSNITLAEQDNLDVPEHFNFVYLQASAISFPTEEAVLGTQFVFTLASREISRRSTILLPPVEWRFVSRPCCLKKCIN